MIAPDRDRHAMARCEWPQWSTIRSSRPAVAICTDNMCMIGIVEGPL